MDPYTAFAAYAQVVEVLFGDGAHELVAKASADLSARDKRDRREETARKIGLATNAAGAIAGPAAIWQATKAAKAGKGGIPRDIARDKIIRGRKPEEMGRIGRGALRAVNALDNPKGRAGALAAAGASASIVGLQVANWAGDGIATYSLRPKKPQDVHVGKSSPDPADIRTQGEDKKKKSIQLNRGTLALKAAETTGPVVVEGGKKTAAGAKWTREKSEPVLRDLARRTKNKIDEVTKSDLPDQADHLDVVWEGEFSKSDDDKRQVFGWASIVEVNGEPVVDLQGDYITPDEIEKAAYTYVMKSRKGGDMHRRDGENPYHVSDMIESFMVTDEKKKILGLPDSTPTGWWVGFQVNDEETWNLVKSDQRKGFSIHGRGKRIPVGES